MGCNVRQDRTTSKGKEDVMEGGMGQEGNRGQQGKFLRKDWTKVLKIFRLNGVERRDMAENEPNARRRCTMWVLFGNQRKAEFFTQNPDGMPKVKIGLDIPLYPRVAGIAHLSRFQVHYL